MEKWKEVVPLVSKLRVKIHSTDMTFYFLIFSATASPGTQSYKFTITVNSKQIVNSDYCEFMGENVLPQLMEVNGLFFTVGNQCCCEKRLASMKSKYSTILFQFLDLG